MASSARTRLVSPFVAMVAMVAFATGSATTGCSERAASTADNSDASQPTCVDGDPQRERYGTSCGCCHRDQFSASGSIASEALSRVDHVEISDDHGALLFLSPNPYGNFFGHRPKLVLPARARLFYRDGTVSEMKAPITDTSCNACHAEAGSAPPIGSP